MAISITGSCGLFSMLQNSLKYMDKDRIKLTPAIVDQLSDFKHLGNNLLIWKTSIAELVPDYPTAISPHNASGSGMGGVWLSTTDPSALTPILWHSHFPTDISADLVSFTNPAGTITNSNLELAGCIAHQDVLQQEVDCTEHTITPWATTLLQCHGIYEVLPHHMALPCTFYESTVFTNDASVTSPKPDGLLVL